MVPLKGPIRIFGFRVRVLGLGRVQGLERLIVVHVSVFREAVFREQPTGMNDNSQTALMKTISQAVETCRPETDTQRAQYPLIQEYGLNYVGLHILI